MTLIFLSRHTRELNGCQVDESQTPMGCRAAVKMLLNHYIPLLKNVTYFHMYAVV